MIQVGSYLALNCLRFHENSHVEVKAWAGLYDKELDDWEIDAMMSLRNTYESVKLEARRPTYPEPFKFQVDEFDYEANNESLLAQANHLAAWAKAF